VNSLVLVLLIKSVIFTSIYYVLVCFITSMILQLNFILLTYDILSILSDSYMYIIVYITLELKLRRQQESNHRPLLSHLFNSEWGIYIYKSDNNSFIQQIVQMFRQRAFISSLVITTSSHHTSISYQ
jgi:hypothetical protein